MSVSSSAAASKYSGLASAEPNPPALDSDRWSAQRDGGLQYWFEAQLPLGKNRKLTETRPVRIKKSPQDVVAASRAS
jgi:hypothetical protein